MAYFILFKQMTGKMLHKKYRQAGLIFDISIKESLKIAVDRVDYIEERIENSNVNWSNNWGQVFNDGFYKKTQSFL
jgi:hypothetical protein